jgi:hypothetical protein
MITCRQLRPPAHLRGGWRKAGLWSLSGRVNIREKLHHDVPRIEIWPLTDWDGTHPREIYFTRFKEEYHWPLRCLTVTIRSSRYAIVRLIYYAAGATDALSRQLTPTVIRQGSLTQRLLEALRNTCTGRLSILWICIIFYSVIAIDYPSFFNYIYLPAVSSLQNFLLKFYFHFSFLLCLLHAPLISCSLIW